MVELKAPNATAAMLFYQTIPWEFHSFLMETHYFLPVHLSSMQLRVLQQLQTFKQSSATKWIVGALSIVVAIVLIITGIWAAREKETRPDKDEYFSVIDTLLSKVMILICKF